MPLVDLGWDRVPLVAAGRRRDPSRHPWAAGRSPTGTHEELRSSGGVATVRLDSPSRVTNNTATGGLGFGGGIFNNGGTLIGAVAPPTPGANVKNNTPDNIVG